MRNLGTRTIPTLSLLLLVGGCSGTSPPDDDDDASVDDVTGTPETPTETPDTTLARCRELGPYRVCDESGDASSGSLIVSGTAEALAVSDLGLCAWGGPDEDPWVEYSCSPGLTQAPVWEPSPFSIDTGYVPTGGSGWVLCLDSGDGGWPVCYPAGVPYVWLSGTMVEGSGGGLEVSGLVQFVDDPGCCWTPCSGVGYVGRPPEVVSCAADPLPRAGVGETLLVSIPVDWSPEGCGDPPYSRGECVTWTLDDFAFSP